jgi:hypothetical protein
MRKPRNAAPVVSLAEVDDDDSANQEPVIEDAKPSPLPKEDVVMADAAKDEEDGGKEKEEDSEGAQPDSNTPPGSPPPELNLNAPEKGPQASASVPTIALPQESASQTPQNGLSTGAATPVLNLIDPEDDILSDSDFPGPWDESYTPPANEAECEDRADYLLKTRFKPMADVNKIIASLTKFAPAQRSTENLYLLAENTQKILKAWQDEYLMLDAKVCNHHGH